MSRAGPEVYSFANGDQRANSTYGHGSNTYEGSYRDGIAGDNERSARDRRTGSYDGFTDGRNGSPSPQADGQPTVGDFARGEWRRRPGMSDPDWSDHSRPRQGDVRDGGSRYAPGQGSKQMKVLQDVLEYIRQEWAFMTENDCAPVQVALQLMDTSSLGRGHQYEQFQEAHKQLQEALRAIVNEHHQGFNGSIGAFHRIQSSIQTSQSRVRTLRNSLAQAKLNLSATKPELKGLVASSQSYDDVLQILGQIEQLQVIPERLEARISEKKFLAAVDILQDALRITKQPEMETITALTALRLYVCNQETSLTDILVEELQSHLYLKSPYCQERWKSNAFSFGQGVHLQDAKAKASTRNTKPIYQFLQQLDLSTPLIEDASRNPEADNYYYIQLLLEALHKMGRLDAVVESIEQRMPIELFRVVDRTNAEVDQRFKTTFRPKPGTKQGRNELELRDSEDRRVIISDLLCSLYSKFGAIAEGHRVVHDVIEGIAKREGISDSNVLTGGFSELWKLYQNEMRSLLHDYLAMDGQTSFRSTQPQSGVGNVFSRNQRDNTKKIFKLANIDNSSIELLAEQENLEGILKYSVPGLVSDSRIPTIMARNDNSVNHDGSATGHKLLVEPSVFNLSALLPPSLSFIQQMREIIPPGSGVVPDKLTSVLDDFLVNVFQPQLDETLTDLSAQIFIELDAFQQDPQWLIISKKPIFKGTSAFFSLITAFCKLLDSIPHDQAFTELILTQMITYYDKCRGHFKSLVTQAQSQSGTGIRLKAAAALAESEEIREIAEKLWAEKGHEQAQLSEKETNLITAWIQESPLEAYDIISDEKSIMSLCLLYSSMKWLASKMSQLRHITHDEQETSLRDGKRRQRRQWDAYAARQSNNEGSPVYLPLTEETAAGFDAVVESYQQLATSVLLTIHMEVRCHLIFSISRSLRSNYMLNQPANEPDSEILALNAELVRYDEDIAHHLRPQEHHFIITGLSLLVDTFLVANAFHIKAMNAYGCDRLQLNMLVIQQNLKNIEHDAVLARSARYFDLFVAGPDAIVAMVKETSNKEELQYSYEELKVLLELCYSEQLASERREVSLQAKKALNEQLMLLSGELWQS